jgi:hypothetical protein
MSWTVARARLAAAGRYRPDADTSELRRELRAERLADAIKRALSQPPELTAEQRCTLASLLLIPSAIDSRSS